MNESPWISIIIPVYNAGQYFEECLQTVCGNTQLDIEIILIDDGSTDGSGNTARKWAAKDVRVRYIQQENQGCSSARNHGIELARGKWIMFVDADDTIEPDTMKKLRVLEPKFEDAEIVCFGCHMNLPENMTELHKLESAITEELALSACGVRRPENGLPETNFASMCWKLYRGDFLRRTNLKIDRELVRGEDLLFNCHAFSEAYSIAFSPCLSPLLKHLICPTGQNRVPAFLHTVQRSELSLRCIYADPGASRKLSGKLQRVAIAQLPLLIR